MSKVVLTNEQAKMVENHRGNFRDLMFKRITTGCSTYLDHLSVEEVVNAFINGYEIEQPEFKVGDWVVRKGKVQQIKFVLASCAIGQEFYYETDKVGVVYRSEIRHATKEEIFWAELGREVGEFVDGDIGIDNENTKWAMPDNLNEVYKKGRLKGFYPAESFKKFPTGN